MALNQDIKDNYTSFLEDGKSAALELQSELNLEDAVIGNIVSSIIVGAMNASISAYDSTNKKSLIDKQILDVVSTTNARDANSAQDILNKQASESDIKKSTELKTKQILDVVSTTNARDANSAQDILNKQASVIDIGKATLVKTNQAALILEQKNMQVATRLRQQGVVTDTAGKLVLSTDGESVAEKNIELLLKQALKVVEDTSQTTKQTELMEKQVFHNCLIQGMKQAADYTLAIANGGLVPDSKMHTNFFTQNKALLAHAGASFAADGNVTIDNPNSDEADILSLGTFSTTVSVTKA